MNRFNEKVAIVTGGTRGIGKGITLSLLSEGAIVIATYANNDKAANDFKNEYPQYSEKLITKKFDVSKPESCELFFDDITAKFEQIHILVNNSGIRKDGLGASLTEQMWDQVMDTNLKGSFFMSKQAILHMMKKRYGRIINISSIGGQLGLPGQSNYAASKAGQIAISKTLSKEVAKRGITVNNVCPGFIETELIDDLDPALVKEYKSQVPMKKFGKVDDVAAAVMFLASDEASYITGTSIEVSGGL